MVHELEPAENMREPMAVRPLENFQPDGAIGQARYELACDYVIDLLRVDDQIRQTNKHLATAVKASATTITKIFGVGPYVAATVKGEVDDISRFPNSRKKPRLAS